jgi:DNA-binding transcriptional LysR family regulator
MRDSPDPAGLRIALVPGVTPDKWAGIWMERYPRTPLEFVQVAEIEQHRALSGSAGDAAEGVIARLPLAPEADLDQLSFILLYQEVPVVVVAKNHVLALAESVTPAEILDEVLLLDPSDRTAWAGVFAGSRLIESGFRASDFEAALDLVAAGSGVVVVPQSIARTSRRRDVVHRPVTGLAPTDIALVWITEQKSALLEEFIGVVRGRTARSTRGAERSMPTLPQAPARSTKAPPPTRRPRSRRNRQGR